MATTTIAKPQRFSRYRSSLLKILGPLQPTKAANTAGPSTTKSDSAGDTPHQRNATKQQDTPTETTFYLKPEYNNY
ncbi:MAG: hypothetical protein AAF151_03470 [Cyanobacteria bacterium J06656_5]